MLPKYIHAFPHLRSLLVPKVSKLGRARPGFRLVFAGGSRPRSRCWGGVGVAAVGLILPPWKNRALLHTVPHQSCTSCPSISSQKPPSISLLSLLVFPAVTRDRNGIMEWFGLGRLKRSSCFHPLLRAETPSGRPGWSKPHSTWH